MRRRIGERTFAGLSGVETIFRSTPFGLILGEFSSDQRLQNMVVTSLVGNSRRAHLAFFIRSTSCSVRMSQRVAARKGSVMAGRPASSSRACANLLFGPNLLFGLYFGPQIYCSYLIRTPNLLFGPYSDPEFIIRTLFGPRIYYSGPAPPVVRGHEVTGGRPARVVGPVDHSLVTAEQTFSEPSRRSSRRRPPKIEGVAAVRQTMRGFCRRHHE